MTFGPGCYDVEVTQFTPICAHPEIPPSTAKTFEVPMPSFVPPTPPNECVCFEFNSPEGVVEPVCGDTGKCSVEIRQAGDDCCSGKYDVIPHIEVPCIPFTFNPALTNVRTGTLAEIGATLTFDRNCPGCSITPHLDIVVPSPITPDVCIPNFDSTNATITLKYRTANQAAGTADHTVPGDKSFIVEKNGECTKPDHETQSVTLGGSGGLTISCASLDEESWTGTNAGGHVKYTFFDKSRERISRVSDQIVSDEFELEQECPCIQLEDAEIDLTTLAGNGLSWGGTGDAPAPILEVDCGCGLEITPVTANDVTAGHPVRVKLGEGAGAGEALHFDGNCALAFDKTKLDFADEDHSHGNISSTGILTNRLDPQKPAFKNKVLVSDPSTGLIDGDTDLVPAKLRAIQSGAMLENGPTDGTFRLSGMGFKTNNTNDAATNGIVINSLEHSISFANGTAVTTKPSLSSDAVGGLQIQGMSLSLVADSAQTTGITLTAQSNCVKLGNAVTLTKDAATGSNAVATCGWVKENFDGATGTVTSVLGVGPDTSGPTKGNVGTGILGGPNDTDKAARCDHAHGNIKKDGKLDQTPLTAGDIVKTAADGTLSAGLGLESNTSDMEVLAGMRSAFVKYGTDNSEYGVQHDSVIVPSLLDEDRLAYFKEDNTLGTLEPLAGEMTVKHLNAIHDVFEFSTDSTTQVTSVIGLKRHAFGDDSTDKQAGTVVFEYGADTATLIPGVPCTEDGETTDMELPMMSVEGTGESQTRTLSPSGIFAPTDDDDEKLLVALSGDTRMESGWIGLGKGVKFGTEGSGTSTETKLQLHWGPGFKMKTGVTPESYDTTPSTAVGALGINDGRGLRIHDVTKMKKGYPKATDTDQTIEGLQNMLEVHRFEPDLAFQTDDRLALNDLFDQNTMSRRVMTEGGNWNRYVRHGGTSTTGVQTTPKEFTIPVLVPYTDYLEDYYAGKNSMDGLDEVKIWAYNDDGLDVEQTLSNIIDILTSVGVGFVHVSSSGLCLAADSSSTETYTRYADK